MTDWGSVYGGGSSTGGSNWGSVYGGTTTTKKKPASSGGGFFDSIGGFLGTSGPLGGIESIIGNAGGQVNDIIHGTPNALYHLPGDILHTLGPGGVSKNLGTPWDKYLPFYHPHEKPDPHNLVQQIARPTSQDIVHLQRGDWHYFAEHPLNPILDIATFVPGGTGLKLARRGALGERLATLARSERVLKVGEHVEPLTASKTLSGRIRQAAFDKFSQAHPDLRVVGANQRMARILNDRARSMALRARLPVRDFQRLTQKLKPDERFAFHVAHAGVPLDDRIAYYRALVAEKPTRVLRNYLKDLERPGVRAALENPRPEFTQALWGGHQLEARAGEHLVSSGQLAPETRVERATLEQGVMGTPETPAANPIHADFPPPSRFPHISKAGGAGQYIAPGTEAMLGKAAPLKQLRYNAAVLLNKAMFHTDPERVLTTDYLSTMRNKLIVDMQKEALDKIAKAPDASLVETGFKRPEEFWYRPSYDRKTTAPVPREVRLAEGINQDRSIIREQAAKERLTEAKNGIVSQSLRDLGVDAKDMHNLERLDQLGIKRVPAAFGKEFRAEFGGTPAAIRYFVDRPLDVWRAITLNFRPAWAVNNFVGNTVMGLATYGPAGAAAYLRVLLRTERGDQKVQSLYRWTFSRPTLRRKYGNVFAEVAPELHSAGLFGTQTKLTHTGVYEGRYGKFAANPAVKVLGFVPKKLAQAVRGVGRGVTKLEVLFAEDTSREAAFLREAGGDIAKVKVAARKMGEGNIALSEALRRLDRPSVEKAIRGVNDALGNFNDLSHVERSVVRRAVPFYSWFKVITKVSGKYAARYPERILMLKNIEQAQNTSGEPALPSWLTGAILLGKPSKGVQALLSTQGINPYETIPQLATGGAGSVLNPALTAGVVGLSGRNPAFGNLQDYYGLGATNRGGWAGQFERGFGSLLSGLAPARLYSQTSQPYQGKLYAPKTYGHVGPVPINDFLLQYLGLPLRHVKLAEAKRERGL